MSKLIDSWPLNSVEDGFIAPQVLGLVLAGGKSSRMGRDKALVEVDGKSFLAITKTLLRQSGAHQLVISSNNIEGAMGDTIVDRGPLGALYSLQSLEGINQYHAVIVCPIDMPFLGADLLNALVRKTLTSERASYYEDHPMPFCFVLNDTFFNVLNRQINNNHNSVKGFLKQLGAIACQLPMDTTKNFENINTPEQLARVNTK